MSRPNTSDDPQAPLLAGDRQHEGADADVTANRQIIIFNRTINLFHLAAIIISILALTAIGISIAAIGISITPYVLDRC